MLAIALLLLPCGVKTEVMGADDQIKRGFHLKVDFGFHSLVAPMRALVSENFFLGQIYCSPA
jgi:hypothetical protein